MPRGAEQAQGSTAAARHAQAPAAAAAAAACRTRGGGGGGGAGDALRTAGGKGGSGVILIRYATNADDSFPVSLASSMQQRWSATDFQ